jgi:hypothetical protein
MTGRAVLILAAALALAGVAGAEEAYRIAWIRQLGTASYDSSEGVAADAAGNVFITGYTYGDLGEPSAGSSDAFVSKYDPAGNLLWTRQPGTANPDGSYGAAADAAGNVLISGETYGDLGGPSAGLGDAFVAKHGPAGNPLWTRQLGTADYDTSSGVAVDASGNVFITGHTHGDLDGPNAGNEDAFVAKYGPAGNLLWTRQLGTAAYDSSEGAAADASGSLLIGGGTEGSLDGLSAGGRDAFVSKYDPAGDLLWTRQLGTASHDDGRGVAVDAAGNVFLCGSTEGSLGGPNAGDRDAFLSKYDPAGNWVWTRQLGTADFDDSRGVAVDAAGNVFITGETEGDLGRPNAGGCDAFVAKYDPAGSLLWTRQLGTADDDWSFGVSAGGFGDVWISGMTYGGLGGPNAGHYDAFVVRLLAPPLVPGDANLDGCVDGLDYNVWSLHYQSSTDWCEGDFNDDRTADGLDYNVWSLSYLSGCEAAAAPEPASAALLILGLWVVGRRRQA